uniref:Uncharacterized protein n=1 Tax=Chromera velia CCMP2878 TaxID=1169474 RepID=A0A0G4FCD9_9ALVE|eukprot:Cvel_3061.t1-p1 / transcript=Cvel_3061.t1 / gene=Cvel_3061 / organism=Chromera_velia_CCMP2878 / gene_product=hypothetical protein / transcript_product=hypothetical protein / location=Cvel_scaffold122:62701-63485(-) / protein_length=176 / sequence_SO=supercontig / SO=protein_coding / is_pseudo=false
MGGGGVTLDGEGKGEEMRIERGGEEGLEESELAQASDDPPCPSESLVADDDKFDDEDEEDVEPKLAQIVYGLDEPAKAKRWVTAKHILLRVRRLIPGPLELRQRVLLVKLAFELVENDGVKLAGEKWERIWELQMVHVDNGCLSDPPSVELYMEKRQSLIKGPAGLSYSIPEWDGF